MVRSCKGMGGRICSSRFKNMAAELKRKFLKKINENSSFFRFFFTETHKNSISLTVLIKYLSRVAQSSFKSSTLEFCLQINATSRPATQQNTESFYFEAPSCCRLTNSRLRCTPKSSRYLVIMLNCFVSVAVVEFRRKLAVLVFRRVVNLC